MSPVAAQWFVVVVELWYGASGLKPVSRLTLGVFKAKCTVVERLIRSGLKSTYHDWPRGHC